MREKERLLYFASALLFDHIWLVILLRLLYLAQVGLHVLYRISVCLLSFVVRYGGQKDHVVSLLPVGWGRDFVLRRQLHRIEHTQQLGEVAPGAHGVAQMKLDLLIGANDE